MLEASLLEENNLSDQKEILSDEEEIYSGTHNAGNTFKTVAYQSNYFSAENHDRRDSSASAHSDSASLSENNPKPINPDTVSDLSISNRFLELIFRFHCPVYQYVRSIHINHLKPPRLFPHPIFVVVWKKALKKIQAHPPINQTQMILLHVRSKSPLVKKLKRFVNVRHMVIYQTGTCSLSL